MLLIVLWSGWETTDGRGEVHWAFLLGWGAVTAAIAWQRWVGGLHLAAVAMSAWIISLGYLLFDGHGHGVVVVHLDFRRYVLLDHEHRMTHGIRIVAQAIPSAKRDTHRCLSIGRHVLPPTLQQMNN